MAGSIKVGGAIDALEDAFHLLRHVPTSAFAVYLAGCVPFLIAFLFFWAEMSSSRSAEMSCLPEALLLAVLFVWMNCAKAVFAGRLRRQLEGVSEPAWSVGRALRLFRIQASVQPWKLVVLPAAFLAVVPGAYASAFFRNVTAFGDGPRELQDSAIKQAKHAAKSSPVESWVAAGILQLLWLVVLANIAMTLAVLPTLVKIFTGYENQFTRSGWHFVLNSTFLAAAVGLTWLAMDPIIQAYYTLRCFSVRSRETGQDLRATLRRIAKTGAIAVIVFALMPASKGLAQTAKSRAPAISAPALNQSIAEVLKQREYQWRLPRAASAKGPLASAIARFIQGITDWLGQAWDKVWRFIERVMEWLFKHLGSGTSANTSAVSSGGLQMWLWILGSLAAAAIVALIVFRLPRKNQTIVAATSGSIDLADERLLASQLPEESWLAMAEEWIGRQDLRMALRALYLGTLAHLGGRELLTINACKSNREYDAELRRKSRSLPEIWPPFHENVDCFERSWYGRHEVSPDHIARFRANLHQIRVAAVTSGALQ